MTLIEFLAPLKNRSNRDRVLALLYFKHRYESSPELTVEEIRAGLKRSRVPGHAKVNIADVLAKSGHYVDSPGAQGKKLLWRLTDAGSSYIHEAMGLLEPEPEVEHDVASLTAALGMVSDLDVREYIEEGIKCLRVGARRASVVFLWTGSIRMLHERMLEKDKDKLNTALAKHDPKVRGVSSLDHFAYVKDRISLLAAQDLGILDKSEKDTLEEALNLRNRCGHPANYKPGEKKVSGFVEDLIQVLFA